MALLPVMALVLMCALAAMYMVCCMSAVPRLPKNCGAVPVAPVAGRASRQPAHPVHVLRCVRSAACGMPVHHILPAPASMQLWSHILLCTPLGRLPAACSSSWRTLCTRLGVLMPLSRSLASLKRPYSRCSALLSDLASLEWQA